MANIKYLNQPKKSIEKWNYLVINDTNYWYYYFDMDYIILLMYVPLEFKKKRFFFFGLIKAIKYIKCL
jgi:hypothetical protein